MQEKDARFLRSLFKSYYQGHGAEAPPELPKREFGIGEPGKKIVKRHLAFANPKAFNHFLREEVPFFISCSTALYKMPQATPMDAKEFQGADLIYEFDAGDIPTPCKNAHDEWSCRACKQNGKGSLKRCPHCGKGVQLKKWVCAQCLEATKQQTQRLLAILRDECGIEEGLSVNFSGNAGYHIHVQSPKVRGVPQHGRLELLDYLTLENLDPRAQGYKEEKGGTMRVPAADSVHGAPHRLRTRLAALIEKEEPLRLAALTGAREKDVNAMLTNRDAVHASLNKGILPAIPGMVKKSHAFWKALLEYTAQQERLNLDRQTSTDIKKIVRVPGTIHGGSGLLATRVALDALKDFDPFTDAVCLKGEDTQVHVESAPPFTLQGEEYGPFEDADETLPAPAAAYLVAKERAHAVGAD